jgi:serine/threonine protein kinase
VYPLPRVDEDQERAQARVGAWLKGRWRIDALVGMGGMAAVYAATSATGGARVAVKILHDDVAVSKELRARFEQEARAVASLGHPATVQVSHVDTTDEGAPFMVMELLEGESLGQRAARGPLDPAEVLAHVEAALAVLVVAHAVGMVHRDIKPDNLFVTTEGRLKVLDFGIARMRQGPSSVRTRTGALLGTTAYMAPEQIHGTDIDGRVDVFAMGSTMFRLLTCKRIHEAETEAALLIKMGTTPAPPVSSVAAVDPRVALIVDRALCFDKQRRYPDARAMLEDVRAARCGESPPFSTAALARELGSAPAPQPFAGHSPSAPRVVVPVSVRSPDAAESSLLGGAKTLMGAPAPSTPRGPLEPLVPTPTASGVTTSGARQAEARGPSKAPIVAAILIGVAALGIGVGVTALVLSRTRSGATSDKSEESEGRSLSSRSPDPRSTHASSSPLSANAALAGSIAERHGDLVLSWQITSTGDVTATLSGAAPDAAMRDAALTIRPLGAGADAREVPLSASGSLLTGHIDPLAANLTEVGYALAVGETRVRGVLHVPRGGTAAIAATAARAASRVPEPKERGPNGGVLQPLGDKLVEIVACRDSGDVRVYLLDDKRHVKKLKRERLELAVVDTWTDHVRLAPHPSQKFSHSRLKRKDDPAKLVVLLEDGDTLEAGLFSLRPGGIVDAAAGSHRAPIFVDCNGNGEVRGLVPSDGGDKGERDDDEKRDDKPKGQGEENKGKGKGPKKKKEKGRGGDD